jgi:ribosomal protein L29
MMNDTKEDVKESLRKYQAELLMLQTLRSSYNLAGQPSKYQETQKEIDRIVTITYELRKMYFDRD